MGEAVLTRLLARRHEKDVFVPQCKTGPTNGSGHQLRILDAWALRRSWANPCTYGYEIKVTRSDFLRDDKWHEYLDFCAEFYFVTPHGLISPSEVPEEAGLIYASKNAARLFIKKKAPRRNISPPVSLYHYLIVNRAKIGDLEYGATDKREFWEKWLQHKRVDRELGYRVRMELSRRIREEILDAQRRNERLQKQLEDYAQLERWLNDRGVDYRATGGLWSLKHRVEQILEVVPADLERTLGNAISAMRRLSNELDDLKAKRRDAA